MSIEETQFLTLLRAELKSAIADLELRMVDRYATKTDATATAVSFAEHEKEDERRHAAILTAIEAMPNDKRISQIADERYEERMRTTWGLRGSKAAWVMVFISTVSVLVALFSFLYTVRR